MREAHHCGKVTGRQAGCSAFRALDTTICPGAGASSAEVRTNFTGTQVPALGWAWLTWLLKVGEAGRVVASICKLFVPLKTKEIWAWLNNPPTSNQPFCAM